MDAETHAKMAASLAASAKDLSPEFALQLLIDATAFLTVFEDEPPVGVTDRFNRSYTVILTAREHIQLGAGRA